MHTAHGEKHNGKHFRQKHLFSKKCEFAGTEIEARLRVISMSQPQSDSTLAKLHKVTPGSRFALDN